MLITIPTQSIQVSTPMPEEFVYDSAGTLLNPPGLPELPPCPAQALGIWVCPLQGPFRLSGLYGITDITPEDGLAGETLKHEIIIWRQGSPDQVPAIGGRTSVSQMVGCQPPSFAYEEDGVLLHDDESGPEQGFFNPIGIGHCRYVRPGDRLEWQRLCNVPVRISKFILRVFR